MSLKPERVDFMSTWTRLKKTCEEVIRVEKVDKREWSDRFSDVYKLCVAFPEPLSERLYSEIRSFLEDHVAMLYEQMSSAPSGKLLHVYYNHWVEFQQGVSYLNKLYMYLNTQHIKKQKASEADLTYGCTEYGEQKLEIGELGLHLWKTNMILPLQHDLVTLLLEAIRADRTDSSQVNESVVHGVILSLVQVEEFKKKGALDLYQSAFESEFLRATGDFYQREAGLLLQESDCSQYMERVLTRLAAENARSRRFLHPSSYAKVTSECEERLVADHLSFLHSECRSMVTSDRRKDLHNMYTLLKPIEMGLPVLVKEVQSHITAIGLQAVTSLSGDNMAQSFVECVLDVHSKYSRMIREVFNSDQQFTGALDMACSVIVNHRRHPKTQSRSPELLSRFCDSLLKKGMGRGMTEAEIDDQLSLSIIVFKYIDDKDVFQKFYAKMFAKRLIHQQSVSMDAEEGMINRLKNACGYEFTSKFHRMFTDIKLSDDLNDSFSQWLKSGGEESSSGTASPAATIGIGFNIFVLQAGAWPLGQAAISPFAVPQPLERAVSYFETFYNKKFNGRKLTWLHHLSTADVRLTLGSPAGGSPGSAVVQRKSYLVSMGTYHMAILHLFESTDCLTYADLQENTRLSEEQLVKHLQSLMEARLILTEAPVIPPSSNSQSPGPSCSSSDPLTADSSPTLPAVPPPEKEASPVIPVTSVWSQPSPTTPFFLNVYYSNRRPRFKITAVVQKEVQQVCLFVCLNNFPSFKNDFRMNSRSKWSRLTRPWMRIGSCTFRQRS